jgi:hypothetical protein
MQGHNICSFVTVFCFRVSFTFIFIKELFFVLFYYYLSVSPSLPLLAESVDTCLLI